MIKNHKIGKDGLSMQELLFTLLVIGVVVSMAVPRLFGYIDYSKGAEAMKTIITLRRSLDRCFMHTGGSYKNCSIEELDIENPNKLEKGFFVYKVVPTNKEQGYAITATLKEADIPSQINVWVNSPPDYPDYHVVGIGLFEDMTK